jgi:uncharacterized membrane protein YqaE (UPF0057 family)
VPPASVLIKRGCGADILINICLWVLGWIPGVCVARSLSLPSCADTSSCSIHAWWIIAKTPDRRPQPVVVY